MNARFLHYLQLTLSIMDILAINIIFFVSQFLFNHYSLITPNIEYLYFQLLLNLFWFLATVALGIYQEKNVTSFEVFTKVSLQAFVYFLLSMLICLYFFRLMMISRIFIFLVLASISISILVNRFIYLLVYQYFKRRDFIISKVAIIGYNSLSKKLAGYLEAEGINKQIVGYYDEKENVRELSNYPILGSIDESLDICLKRGVTEIYSTISPEHNHTLYQLIQKADQNCIRFRIVPDLGFFFNKQMHIEHLKEIPLISLRKEPLQDLGNKIKKRLFDIVVSAFVLIFVLSWLIPLIAVLIWIESKGPVFFGQERTGRDNKNFRCLKFRSMRMNEQSNVQQATRNDSRVTRIGKFLRRSSLDELPQFINVFRGHMSVIGPRPHMLKHTDEYSKLIGQYMVRQFVKPGITGWAQVNGFRGETQDLSQMQQRVDHDLWYLENWNLLLDLRILFMTIMVSVKGDKNAY